MTEQKTITAERVIDAPAKEIFDVLSNPERHHETDATGMVGTDQKSDRIQATGDTFVMNMSARQGNETIDYQTKNHVTGFADGKLIAWQPGLVDRDDTIGVEWLYELEPQGADSTSVRLTYDWRNASAKIIEKFGIPAFDENSLAASLGKLAEAVAG